MHCRINKTAEWSLRLLHESDEWLDTVFVTLTYSDETLPNGGTLVSSDLQKWVKRFRSEIYPRRIKYYAVGEYGEKSQRPHYHAIMFGVGKIDIQTIQETWGLGHVKVLPFVGLATGNYVAGYVQKKLYGNDAKYYEEKGLQPPFAYMSKKLGASYAQKNAEQITQQLYVQVNGIPKAIPRYYRKQLGITAEMFGERIEQQRKEIIKYHLDRYTAKEMAEFIQPPVIKKLCYKYLDGSATPGEEYELFMKLIAKRVSDSRKQAALITKQKLNARPRKKL